MNVVAKIVICSLLLAMGLHARADGSPSTRHILLSASQGDAAGWSWDISTADDDDLIFGEEADDGTPHIAE